MHRLLTPHLLYTCIHTPLCVCAVPALGAPLLALFSPSWHGCHFSVLTRHMSRAMVDAVVSPARPGYHLTHSLKSIIFIIEFYCAIGTQFVFTKHMGNKQKKERLLALTSTAGVSEKISCKSPLDGAGGKRMASRWSKGLGEVAWLKVEVKEGLSHQVLVKGNSPIIFRVMC